MFNRLRRIRCWTRSRKGSNHNGRIGKTLDGHYWMPTYGIQALRCIDCGKIDVLK